MTDNRESSSSTSSEEYFRSQKSNQLEVVRLDFKRRGSRTLVLDPINIRKASKQDELARGQEGIEIEDDVIYFQYNSDGQANIGMDEMKESFISF